MVKSFQDYYNAMQFVWRLDDPNDRAKGAMGVLIALVEHLSWHRKDRDSITEILNICDPKRIYRGFFIDIAAGKLPEHVLDQILEVLESGTEQREKLNATTDQQLKKQTQEILLRRPKKPKYQKPKLVRVEKKGRSKK